ncbi:hypothetical protein YA62_014825 [Agrobacterium sp. LC34]|uniref:Uncharacterized protein n=1 Tax=Agrobacterium tomkonis CFBP 6623 TaxID=1183432 RepID=A0A1S7RPM7_9HYPH|nr:MULTISPECIES: hypothetical protein [Agrobacterium]KRA55453.1 hypothetical protein ASD85_20355 [Rhizobium sp. Root651]QCL91761.1 hypothetical protein CFBP6623_21720 [Agrobacterium tumefaciens]TKT59073.1 hypothetical protein YA62_014825 [Agrobacterium sp. LC34]CUX55691.1 hypothetical protein AGR3A_Lc140195 [Agrobacterium tomkonis CFBP 6623]
MHDSDKRISYGVRRLSPLLTDDMNNGLGAQFCSQFQIFSILNMRDDDDIGAVSFEQIDIRKVVPIMIILAVSYTIPLPV